jgi:leucyl-tRNA synthetase
MPVDLYVGGAEHAVLHLLYARFWTKAIADLGLIPFREPFSKLLNQGQLLGPDGSRMAKSRGNVITPDRIVETIGADALRLYEMFMAPFDQDIAWNEDGINGARRFLNRIWHLYGETYFGSAHAIEEDTELLRIMHKTIRRVDERIENFRFNTMVSTLMEYVNSLSERHRLGTWQTATFHHALNTLLLLMAPAAPHIAEELWSFTGHDGSVHQQQWPSWDIDLARDELVNIPVQVNGRVRLILEVAADARESEVQEMALIEPKIREHIAGRHIHKVIYIPGKIINVVTR